MQTGQEGTVFGCRSQPLRKVELTREQPDDVGARHEQRQPVGGERTQQIILQRDDSVLYAGVLRIEVVGPDQMRIV